MNEGYGMTCGRFDELMANDDLQLTAAEVASGWHFCTEMDGLLANKNDPKGDCFCNLRTNPFDDGCEKLPILE